MLRVVTLIVFATVASAATIVNGNFEAPVCSLPVCGGPSGWTVTQGNVEIVTGSLWQQIEGNQSVDLDGTAIGGMSQDIVTVPGVAYRIAFYLAGNMAGGQVVKDLRVLAGSTQQDYTFDTTGHSLTNMGWTAQAFDFTATSALTTLEFRSMDTVGCCYGPVIDDVRISELTTVPEPASLFMIGSGLAALGLLRRK